MATIYNTDLTRELLLAGRLQVSKDTIPTQIAEKVVPVVEVNPKLLRRSEVLGQLIGRNTTTTGTAVVSANLNKDIIITGIMVSSVQDAACDNAYIAVLAYIGGAQRYLYLARPVALTAQAINQQIMFAIPIRIDRNTAVSFAKAFAAGTSTSDCVVMGYYDDVSNA